MCKWGIVYLLQIFYNIMKDKAMWDTVYGHESNKKFLANMLQGERKTPSLLFYGPEGIGKKRLAFEFARSFLCLDDPLGDCTCRSCRAMRSGTHPDFIYVEGQGKRHDILIEQVKELERKAAFAPVLSSYKVCVIDDADLMRVEAANSLLKLLEEPPSYWLFILVASQVSRMLPTIRSRVMALRFQPLSREDTRKVMRTLAIAQGDVLATLSDGSPGKALALSDADALTWRERVLTVLERIDDPCLMGNLAALDWLDRIGTDDTRTALEMILLLLRDAMMLKEDRKMPLYSEDLRGRVAFCFADWSLPGLERALRETDHYWRGTAQSVNGRTILEALFLQLHCLAKE